MFQGPSEELNAVVNLLQPVSRRLAKHAQVKNTLINIFNGSLDLHPTLEC